MEENKTLALITLDQGRQIQSYGTLAEPLFMAKDVADLLSISNPSKMCEPLDEDEKLLSQIVISGQRREVLMITEYGLYEILMLSRKKIAKQFKKGVKKVLKSLRLNGGYLTNQQGTDKESFEKAVADRSNVIVASQLKELNFWRNVASDQNKIIGELKSQLNQLGY